MAVDLSKYVRGLRIESAFLPDIYLPDPFAPNQKPNPFLQALKPKITLETSLGNKTMTPYGDPGPSHWPTIKRAFWIGGIAFLAWRILK